jgi:hypothetical protein
MDYMFYLSWVYIIALPFIFMILLEILLRERQFARKCSYYMRLNIAHQLMLIIPISFAISNCIGLLSADFGEVVLLLAILFFCSLGGISCALIFFLLESLHVPNTVVYVLMVILQSLLFAWWMGRIYFHMMLMDELESNPPMKYFFLRPEVRWYWLGFVVNALLLVPSVWLLEKYF